MTKLYFIIFFLIGIGVSTTKSGEAAGAVEGQKRKQQQQVDAVTQQILSQRNQAIEKAKHQIIQQKQQAQQRAAQQKAIYQQQQTLYQQALQQKQLQQQTIQQAAYQQALRQRQSVQQSAPSVPSQGLVSGTQNPQQISFDENVDPSQVQDVTTIAQIWKAMEQSSEVWSLMVETQAKALTVARQIDLYKQENNITIAKDPMHYAQMIDEISSQNPELLKKPFKDVLRFVAILEYDFDNGQDKNTMAINLLGEKMYLENRKRLGL